MTDFEKQVTEALPCAAPNCKYITPGFQPTHVEWCAAHYREDILALLKAVDANARREVLIRLELCDDCKSRNAR